MRKANLFKGLWLLPCFFLMAASTQGAEPETPEVDQGWLSGALKKIAASEYRFSRQDDLFTAPNRSQNLRSRLGANGVEVVSRTRGADPASGGFTLTLRLSAFGREGALHSVEPSSPYVEGERIEYWRRDLVEWYLNFAKRYRIPKDNHPCILIIDRKGIIRARISGALNARNFSQIKRVIEKLR